MAPPPGEAGIDQQFIAARGDFDRRLTRQIEINKRGNLLGEAARQELAKKGFSVYQKDMKGFAGRDKALKEMWKNGFVKDIDDEKLIKDGNIPVNTRLAVAEGLAAAQASNIDNKALAVRLYHEGMNEELLLLPLTVGTEARLVFKEKSKFGDAYAVIESERALDYLVKERAYRGFIRGES